MSAPTTQQLDAYGTVCAALVTAFNVAPSGIPALKSTKVRQAVDAWLDEAASAHGIGRASLDSLIEASAGYTNTGGTGAICQ